MDFFGCFGQYSKKMLKFYKNMLFKLIHWTNVFKLIFPYIKYVIQKYIFRIAHARAHEHVCTHARVRARAHTHTHTHTYIYIYPVTHVITLNNIIHSNNFLLD